MQGQRALRRGCVQSVPVFTAVAATSLHRICGRSPCRPHTLLPLQVRLKEYGSELIEVADNGSGVDSDNYQALTLKYHTSKARQLSSCLFSAILACAQCDLERGLRHTRFCRRRRKTDQSCLFVHHRRSEPTQRPGSVQRLRHAPHCGPLRAPVADFPIHGPRVPHVVWFSRGGPQLSLRHERAQRRHADAGAGARVPHLRGSGDTCTKLYRAAHGGQRRWAASP